MRRPESLVETTLYDPNLMYTFLVLHADKQTNKQTDLIAKFSRLHLLGKFRMVVWHNGIYRRAVLNLQTK